jgi:hypothetical protein
MYFLIFLILFITNVRGVPIVVEPSIGYALNGKGETKFSNAHKIEHLYTSVNYGLKLGTVLGKNHLVGIDYSIQSHFLDSEQNSGKASDNVERSQLGIVYNYLFKKVILLLGYYPLATLEGEDGDSSQNQVLVSSDHFEKGSMMSVGFGIRYMKNMNINLQYRQYSFSGLVLNGSTSSTHISTELSDMLFSISFPIGFLK